MPGDAAGVQPLHAHRAEMCVPAREAATSRVSHVFAPGRPERAAADRDLYHGRHALLPALPAPGLPAAPDPRRRDMARRRPDIPRVRLPRPLDARPGGVLARPSPLRGRSYGGRWHPLLLRPRGPVPPRRGHPAAQRLPVEAVLVSGGGHGAVRGRHGARVPELVHGRRDARVRGHDARVPRRRAHGHGGRRVRGRAVWGLFEGGTRRCLPEAGA